MKIAGLSACLLLAALPALAQPSGDPPPPRTYFRPDPSIQRGPDGRRTEPDAAIGEALRRREQGLPPARPAPQPQQSAANTAWLRQVQRAIANSSAPRTDAERLCRNIAEQIYACRINPPPPPTAAATDPICVARNMDNRNWQGDMARLRSDQYLSYFVTQCSGWVIYNQAEPLRR